MARGDIDVRGNSVAGGAHDSERRSGLRAVGAVAARITAPIVGHRGSGFLARLKAGWRTIVGDTTAGQAWPEALSRDGALRLRVLSGAAIELQHGTPLLIERINLFFGRAVVARIVILQGPLPVPPAAATPLRHGWSDSPSPAADAVLAARLADVADPALRAALTGLGRLVLASSEETPEADVAPLLPND